MALIKSGADNATSMPSLEGKKIMMGFWHNWASDGHDGYQQGTSKAMTLLDIPEAYNVVAVSFMKGEGIPTFKPYNATDEEFRRQIAVLNSQGRVVLISLGGADAHIELKAGDEQAFADELIRLVETYGFDGLDIDLEQSAIIAADNKTVLPAALKMVKDYYKAQGKHFIISMAPEYPYLREGGNYLAYITALEGYYDFIAPQFYNQGGDGIWVDEKNAWITQNNDAMKEDFLFYMTQSIVTGTRGYVKIPANKFAIGLPSSNDAAATGYVVDPTAVYNAFARLDAANLTIKGLMTWSINWDNGQDKAGKAYNWEFCNRYTGLIHGGSVLPVDPEEEETTDPVDPVDPVEPVEPVEPETPDETPVVPDEGGSSDEEYPAWELGHQYMPGDKCTYKGAHYVCINSNLSNAGWTPDICFTLWQAV